MGAAARAGVGVSGPRFTFSTRRRLAVLLALVAAALAFGPRRVAAQQTHVLIVTGLSGEPRFATTFEAAARAIYDAAKSQWKVADSSLFWLAEDPTRDRARIHARAGRESVAAAMLALSERVATGDRVLVVLIGHGSGERDASRVNLPGPDPTAADYRSWLSGFTRQHVVFVNAASGSGDFIDVLKSDGRVVMTATRSSFERNESLFAAEFARGLGSGAADADKDGRVSALEALQFADIEVARTYETAGTLRTEHPLLSDSTLAARVSFGPPAAGADNPRVRALIAERAELERAVTALRARKGSMAAEAYEAELERLLVAIAEKTVEIRAAGGRP